MSPDRNGAPRPQASPEELRESYAAADGLTELLCLSCGAASAGVVVRREEGFDVVSLHRADHGETEDLALPSYLECVGEGGGLLPGEFGAEPFQLSGDRTGMLFVVKPRMLEGGLEHLLRKFAKQVESTLEHCHVRTCQEEAARFFGSRVESAIEGAMILDRAGRITETNDTGRKFLETETLSDSEGIDFLEMVSPGYREEAKTLLERAFGGTEGLTEFRFTGKKGSEIWLETLFSPLRDSQGDIDCVLAIHRDISVWKKHEKDMLLQNDGLEHSMSGFDLVDDEGKFLYANRAYLDMWGYDSRDEVIGKSPAQHCLDPEVPRKIISTLKEKGSCRIEFTALRKDGSTFEALMSARLINDADGREIYTGSTVDITERKKTEEALLSSREYLSSLISSVDGVVWEADPVTFRFTYVSPRVETILGYSPSQWLESDTFWVDHIHPDDRDYALTYCKECTGRNEDHEFIYRMITADGRIVWLRDLVSVGVEDDRATSLRGIMVDITEQKNAELRIQQLNRTHSVLSEINQLIVREKDPRSFLVKVCQIATDKGLFDLAWIGLLQPETGNLEMVAHAGGSDADVETLKSILDPGGDLPASSFASKSLVLARSEVCNEVPILCEAARKEPDESLELGYRSIASLPLIQEGRVVGNFNLYSSESGFFDESEMELLDRLAEDISFSLSVYRKEQKRRAVERELRTSQEKLTASMQIARLGDWEYDLEKHCFKLNEQIFDMLRVSIDELGSYEMSPTQLFRTFGQPQDIPKLMAHLYRMISPNDEKSVRLEVRVKLGDGESGWFAIQAFSERDEEGRSLRVHGIVQDITERKAAEDAILEVEHRFRRLIEHSSDCIVLVDSKHRVLYASPSACEIEGVGSEQLSGRDIFDNLHPEDVEMLDESFTRLLDAPAVPVELSWRKRTDDGDTTWLEGVATNLLSEPGVEAIVINYRDVTARKQLEEEFRQSQKLEAIGQLAGGVAHDFNNILTIISGYGSLLMMDGGTSSEADEAAMQIVQASERAAGLTRQLLAFSRRQVLQLQHLDLNENVTSLTSMLQRILGEDVRLIIELHDGALFTRADAGMLDQLLMNLVVNSRDAMPDGGTLTIETKSCRIGEDAKTRFPDLQLGAYVQIRVCDSGVGISEENLTKIFEPFFTTKDQGKGTGLGLATVFGIVKQHSGAVSVESEVGKGTCFTILLPAVEAEAGLAGRMEVESPIESGSETILLVEDEEPVRNLGRHVLERAGYSVIEAANGVEAIETWGNRKDEVDLLLTDMVMPGGISGFDLAGRLQEDDPELGVIFISGYSADIAGQELNLQEGQNFIQKPCSPRSMLEIVRKCLDERVRPLYS